MEYLLIRNARICNGKLESDTPLQMILVAGGRIVAMGQDVKPPLTNTIDLDAKGNYLLPALLSLSNPRPIKIDADALQTMNFENLTAGFATIVTVSQNIEDNIEELKNCTTPLLNYSLHFPLRSLTQQDLRRHKKIMLLNGVTTALVRFGEERRTSISSIANNISTARTLGLRVLYDFRGLLSGTERMQQLTDLCSHLQKDPENKAYIIGVEHVEELRLLEDYRGAFNLMTHLCYDPFGQSSSGLTKLSSQSIIDTLRSNRHTTLGLAYSVGRVNKEGWPDMTPEIVSRNILPMLAAMPAEQKLSIDELEEYSVVRPAQALGLTPTIAKIAEGSTANLIVWNNNIDDFVSLNTPRGNVQQIPLHGRIESVVMNGKIVMTDKFHHDAVCGEHIYARLL